MTPDLEDAANALELHGESRAADFLRRIELERADAARKALESAVKSIQGHKIRGETYRKALKLAVRLIREVAF